MQRNSMVVCLFVCFLKGGEKIRVRKLPENWLVEIALQILPLVILFYCSRKKSSLLFILKSNLFYLPRSLFSRK